MALPLQQPPNAFAPKPPMAPQAPQVNPYDDFRKQAQLRANTQQQQAQTAMQRRFASMGGGPSGARIKMEQDVQRQGNEDLANQIGSINAHEAQANTQAQQFDKQFGLEQTKSLAGIDMARRSQALDELGQNYNMVNEMYKSPMSFQRAYDELNNLGGYLNRQQGAGGMTQDYYAQLQALANPMLRRLQAGDQQVQTQGVA